MKNITRMSIAAIALVSLLGVTGCTDNSKKPEGFSDKVQLSVNVPEQWKDGAGWVQDRVATDIKDNVLAIGDKTGYLAANKSGSGFHLVVVDSKGEKVYSSEESSQADVSNIAFARAYKDGKAFLVFTQTDGKKDDDVTSKKSTQVVIVDDSGKEVSSQKLDNIRFVNVVYDGILVTPVPADSKADNSPTQIIDVADGKVSDIPKRDGFSFAGRFDGVDVFSQNGVAKGAMGKITDGTWTVDTRSVGLMSKSNPTMNPVPTEFVSAAPVKVGKFLQVQRTEEQTDPNTGAKTPLCDLLDPHTGKGSSNVGGGQCMMPLVTSPDGTYIYYGSNAGSGIVSMSNGKSYTIPANNEFSPTAISDDGDVFGTTPRGYAAFNLNGDDSPKALIDTTSVPVAVSKSGLAAFIADGKLGFVFKKQ